jgi:hypothetical protein
MNVKIEWLMIGMLGLATAAPAQVIDCPKAAACYAYKKARDGRQVLVFWDKSAVPSNANEITSATVRIQGGALHEPVWVDLITGGIYEFPREKMSVEGGKATFRDTPVYDAPAVITEKSLVLK